MTESLLKTGKHTVTALTRPDSKSELPKGVEVAKVDYDDHASLVHALKGQDALVITLSVMAPGDQQSKLIKAAAEAGVPWVLPNEWAPDTADEGLVQDVFPFQKLNKAKEECKAEFEKHGGKSAYIAVSTGFWYEWSVAIPAAYGFDVKNKEVTFFDEGDCKISTSTWPQVGRAVAALLSLPVKPENGDAKNCLENFKNQQIYVNSFTLTQKEIFASILRVTGEKERDWKITKEPSKDRYEQAKVAMQSGDRSGFARMMYTRVFYPDGNGDFEARRGTLNAMLGLPKEDLDKATEAAVERARQPSQWH